jgi:hypothetical protein
MRQRVAVRQLPHRVAGMQLDGRRAEAQGSETEGLDFGTVVRVHPHPVRLVKVIFLTSAGPCTRYNADGRGEQSEHKIDQIEDRLSKIEQLLQTIASGLGSNPIGSRTGSTAASTPTASSTRNGASPSTRTSTGTADPSTSGTTATGATPTIDNGDGDSPFEGNSSMAAHTVFASEFLEHAVERTSLRDLSPSMAVALTSLKQLAGMQSRGNGGGAASGNDMVPLPAARPLPPGGFRELPMPPLEKVIEILREMKETGLGGSSMIRCFVSLHRFTEHCRRVYFPADEFSLATYTVVMAGLFYVFEEKRQALRRSSSSSSSSFSFSSGEADALSELSEYCRMCRENLETAISHLTIILPARQETVEALLLAVSFSVETGRPSIAWQLNSTAALHCITMGWHRQPTAAMAAKVSQEELDSHGALFWLAYIMDKGLALRLGRNSIIQDYDVTLSKTLGSTLDSNEVWRGIITSWIHHAEAQGRTYEQLYSSRSLSAPQEQRIQHASAIAADIDRVNRNDAELYERARQQIAAMVAKGELTEQQGKFEGKEMEGMFKSDQVSHWSTLTLVYRAIPPPPGSFSSFSAECIEAARSAFRMHFECMAIIGSSEGQHNEAAYLNWTILYHPFVPFIVLFCNVIETCDADDLQRLSNFVTSLESGRATISAVDKLYRLCQMLYNVAVLYIEAKSKQQQDADMVPLGNDVDMYLNALGLVPSTLSMNMPAGLADGSSSVGFDGGLPSAELSQVQTAQLGDWFSGNRYMMGLMEEDLPFTWS